MKKAITVFLAAAVLLSALSGCELLGRGTQTDGSVEPLNVTENLSGLDSSVIDGLSLFLDGKKVETSDSFFRWEQGFVMIRIAELSQIMGYQFGWQDEVIDNGNYYLKRVEPDIHGNLTMERRPDIAANSFYIGWDDSEYIFSRDAEIAYYAPFNSEYQAFKTDYPLRLVGGIAYLSLDMARRAFHLQMRLDTNSRQLHLVREETAAKSYPSIAKKHRYKAMESSGISNLYGFMVASKGKNKKGVVTNLGKAVTKFKYKDILFMPDSHQFMVSIEPKNDETVYGVVDTEGEEIIPCIFSGVSVFANRPDIYMVCHENRYGLIKGDGTIILEPEYDSIGSSTYSEQYKDIGAQSTILGDCVSVKKNGKWGIYTLDGKEVLPIEYDSMGKVVIVEDAYGTTTPTNHFEIYFLKAVIVGKDGKYGAVNRDGDFVLPLEYDSIEYDYLQSAWYCIRGEQKTKLG